MKKRFLIITAFLSFGQIIFAQADLTIVGGVGVVAPNPVHVGITINVTFNVQNIGNTTAAASNTGIYLSPTPFPEAGKLLSKISLESLSAGSSSNNIQFNYPIPYDAVGDDGTFYVIVKLNDGGTIAESNYSNNSANTAITANHTPWAAQNIPYPIIFVHGYMSDNTTWNDLIDDIKNTYGWSYGGNMDFCLNYDGNNNTSILSSDYHDFILQTGHTINPNPCDFYTVNFANNPSGIAPYDNQFESNQAAITKQGLAIQDAIKHVLAITGKDKVILVCHSMGGLAAREYLQNVNLFQESDGKKHIAKLCTIGTPHGGTNILALDLPAVFPQGNDGSSEAIRDLRTSYYYSEHPGAYLFDGLEDNHYMIDQAFSDFHNVNVNCNGIPSGESINGINHKAISIELSYSCLIGTGQSLPINGDGVVTEYSANINNFKSVDASTFLLPKASGLLSVWHINLTKQFADIVKGMDEPNDYANTHAYKISSGEIYYGLTSYQSVNSPARDYDYYKINVISNGTLNLQVYGITTSVFSLDVKNASGNSVYSINSNGKSYINTNVSVAQGLYNVVLSGIPTATSYKYPYSFKCTFSAITTYCIGTANLLSATGTFSDGSGNNNYNNNSDCKWKIHPNGASSITLSFSAFNLSNPGDTVYVYNGGTTTSPLLGKWTGNTVPNNITSTGGTMLVKFLTDAANTAPGWAATYTSVIVPTYCNGETILTSASGNFSDGSGVTNYGNNAHCSWLINPPNAFSVTLNFIHFNTSDSNDIVNVYDGNDNTSVLMGSFFGNTIPSSLTSTGGAMFIEFITDDSVTAAGWNASYTSFILNSGNGIVKYEYWFDNSYANLFSTPTAPQSLFQLNSTISTTGLSEGLHTFQIRFKDNNDLWSLASSSFLYKYNQIFSGMGQYEYWFDSDYSNKITSTVTNTTNLFVLSNLSPGNISEGLHTFNIRFKPDGKKWSSVSSSFFYKIPVPVTGAAKYQYWFDTNSQDSVTTAFTSTNNFILLDSLINTVSVGLHTLNIRFKPDGGLWSSVVSNFFYKNAPTNIINNTIARCVYWYDDNWQNPNLVYYNGQQNLSSIINTDATELGAGMHRVSMMFRDERGLWSSVVSDSFNRAPITSPVCPFNNKQFVSQAFLSNNANRQWQIDVGAGFVNLVNNANYSGINSDSLQIINAPTSWYGYKYRCVLTDGSSSANSQVFTLKFFLIWNGATDTGWENPSNWSCNTLPDGNTDVIINSTSPRFPLVNSNVFCRSLTTNPGVSVTVTTGNNLTITH